MQRVVSYATGMYWKSTKICSEIKICNFVYLSTGHPVLTSASTWGSVVIFRSSKGSAWNKKFGKPWFSRFTDCLGAGQFGFWNPVRKKRFSLLRNPLASLWDPPRACKLGTGVFSRGWTGWGVDLIIHPHLAARLRISGALPLLPTVLPMACYGITTVSITTV